mgnify:CR=1 FL=1
MPEENFSLSSIQVSLSPQERFEEFLQSRGKRNTDQRKLIVDHIFQRHNHFDADSLIDELGRQVGRATVYRTLTELVDAGMLRKLDLDGRAVFEHDYGYPQHDHLYCEKCQKLIEFQSDELARIRDAVAREHRFRASGHRLIVHGICDECSRAGRKRRRLDRI